MKYCKQLFHDLNFEPTDIRPCCDMRRIGIPRVPFSGGNFDMESYFESIKTFFFDLQKDSSPCVGCPSLVSKPTGFSLVMKFDTISVNQHRHFCNCRCKYCDLWYPKYAATSPRPYAIHPVLKQLRTSNLLSATPFLSWGGGEPTLLEEFEETNKWAMENDFVQYVHTNALQISPSVVNMLYSGKGKVNVSLDSYDSESYQNVKGVDGWEAVINTLKTYMGLPEARQRVDVKYLIYEENNRLSNIHHFFGVCRDLGVTNVQYSFNFREINKNAVSKKSLHAAMLFRKLAKEMNMTAAPFFLPQKYLQLLNKLEQ